ncbi:hypothetical protein OIU76_027904 [Salix suchowensis]|uniref:Uncharacterized protein n=1 Tax=Salix suchowensis TaxID=1278906 RepID=A0ABQ9B180_9ROSI|nr:hypothetical protein OIU76_027904 [Salix suchowensis]KAJ6370853.1 hypothetical protein OIU77_001374 [Salix suchowensis]
MTIPRLQPPVARKEIYGSLALSSDSSSSELLEETYEWLWTSDLA